MILIASHAEAAATRHHAVLPNGTGYHRTNYIGNGSPVASTGATCYLIEQEPDSIILPHFHQANQFQVIVGGEGRLGKTPVASLTVHFAAAHTPYGPIRSESRGVQYFTLRDAFDPGARFMPGARAELPKVRRRHATAAARPPSAAEALAALAAPTCDTVIAAEPDGLAAWLTRLPPRAPFADIGTHGVGDRFHLLVSGALVDDGDDLAAWTCLFVPNDRTVAGVAAGAAGAELLTLQFPKAPAS